MNILSTIGCRAFQTVMKWAIPFLPYREPKILHSVQQVPALLQDQDISCVLLVTDRFLHNSGLIDPLKHALTVSGIRYVLYDETSSNPTVSNVETARTLYLSNGCQGLIGFGGGSAIDCAKAVGARIARPRKSISWMRGILRILRPIPYLIAIPTTKASWTKKPG